MKKCLVCRKKAEVKGYCDKHYRKYDINAFLNKVYKNMRQRVLGIQKNKSHIYLGLSILSKEEFIKWSKENQEFIQLYTKWYEDGFKRTNTPSIDRIDSNKGYVLDNIRWLPNWQNCAFGCMSDKRRDIFL